MKKLLLILVTVALVVIPVNALSVPGTTEIVEPEVVQVNTTTVEPVQAEEVAEIDIQKDEIAFEVEVPAPIIPTVERSEPVCGCDHTEIYDAIDELRDRLTDVEQELSEITRTDDIYEIRERLLILELYGYEIDPNLE